MHIKFLLLVLACCLSTPVFASTEDVFTLYLVRHAEKQADGSHDPALTKAGQQRAERLATWLMSKDIEAVWSSDYQRTRATAQPLGTKLDIEVSIYDPRNQAELFGELLAHKDNALVVGHSNTVPELARMLCECEIANMDETEYDRLIVITIDGAQANVKTLNQAKLN